MTLENQISSNKQISKDVLPKGIWSKCHNYVVLNFYKLKGNFCEASFRFRYPTDQCSLCLKYSSGI